MSIGDVLHRPDNQPSLPPDPTQNPIGGNQEQINWPTLYQMMGIDPFPYAMNTPSLVDDRQYDSDTFANIMGLGLGRQLSMDQMAGAVERLMPLNDTRILGNIGNDLYGGGYQPSQLAQGLTGGAGGNYTPQPEHNPFYTTWQGGMGWANNAAAQGGGGGAAPPPQQPQQPAAPQQPPNVPGQPPAGDQVRVDHPGIIGGPVVGGGGQVPQNFDGMGAGVQNTGLAGTPTGWHINPVGGGTQGHNLTPNVGAGGNINTGNTAQINTSIPQAPLQHIPTSAPTSAPTGMAAASLPPGYQDMYADKMGIGQNQLGLAATRGMAPKAAGMNLGYQTANANQKNALAGWALNRQGMDLSNQLQGNQFAADFLRRAMGTV